MRLGAGAGALAAAGALLAANAGVAAAPMTALYADPGHADISGLWQTAGELTFGPGGAVPTLKPPYDALYAKRVKAWNAGAPIDDLPAECLPPGMPHILVTPYPFELMQTPGRVTVLYEYAGQVRRIFTDGTLPAADADPGYYGFSAGHWEGDTLVVKTDHIRDDTQVDQMGLPHSAALTITERIRRVDADTLEDVVTLDDPVAYTAPFTVRRLYKLHPAWRIGEYVCEENNRNRPDAQGVTSSGVPKAAKDSR